MVTTVKYRKALLNNEVEECIRETMKGISERYEIVIDKIGFDQNHIHIFCGSHPSMAPMSVLSIINSITGRKIFERFPKLKKEELWGGAFWSVGKYIGTVGEATNEKIVKRYIRNQSIDKSESENRIKQLKLFKI
jgi:putative transposase